MASAALSVFRHLIADVDADRQVIDDATASLYLEMQGVEDAASPADSWSVRRAAADALEAIAVSEVLVSKVIRTQDLSVDGTKVADSLLKIAAQFRKRADEDEEKHAEDAGDVGISVMEFSPYPGPVWW